MDIMTSMVLCASISVVCTALATALWWQNRKNMNGTQLWALHFLFLTCALVLVTMKNNLSAFFSVFLAASVSMVGMLAAYIGFTKFFNKKKFQAHNIIYLLFFIAVHYYFSIIDPTLYARNINLSLGLIFISGQIFWFLSRLDEKSREIARNVSFVYFIYFFINICRVIQNIFVRDRELDFYSQNNFDALFYVSYALMLIWLISTLVVTVNKRLAFKLKENEDELEDKVEELDKVNQYMVGRELKMAELKKEIQDLKKIKVEPHP